MSNLSVRKRLDGKALTQSVSEQGVDAVNSDEEQNGLLDESQQELFISQMTLLVGQYVGRWKAMFAWTVLFVSYITLLDMFGMFPPTRWLVTAIEFKSLVLTVAIFPVLISVELFHVWPLLMIVSVAELAATFRMWQMVTRPDSQKYAIAYFAVLSLIVRSGLIYMYAAHWGGRHIVSLFAFPLLCVSAYTLISSQSAANEGLRKLDKFKYHFKKA